jgi:hypothetical protein
MTWKALLAALATAAALTITAVPAAAAPDTGTAYAIQNALDSGGNGQLIKAHGSGNQLTTTAGADYNTYVRIDFYNHNGNGLYEYQQFGTNLCIKVDPNITGNPVVSYPCASGHTSITATEELLDFIPDQDGGFDFPLLPSHWMSQLSNKVYGGDGLADSDWYLLT